MDKINEILNERERLLRDENSSIRDKKILENILLINAPEYFNKDMTEKLINKLIRLEDQYLKYVIPQLIEMLKDLNWPGSMTSLEFLSKLPSDKYISHLEDCMKLAIDDNDYDWIYGIFYLIENAQIQEKDFNNNYIYKKSKEIYDIPHP